MLYTPIINPPPANKRRALVTNLKSVLPKGAHGVFKPGTDITPLLAQWSADISSSATPNEVTPPNTHLTHADNQWVVISAMQKAIRRGDAKRALKAAAALYNKGLQEKILKRLAVITLEDISIPGLPVAGLILFLIEQKAQAGWARISYIVNLLCQLPKDRSYCDVGSVMECNNPPARAIHEELDDSSVAHRLSVFTDDHAPIIARARAARMLGKGSKDAKTAFADACEIMELPAIGVYVMEHYKKVHSDDMWTAIPMTWEMATRSHLTVNHTQPPETVDVGGVPSYALDMHCKSGRKVLSEFKRQPDIKAFFKGKHLCISDTALGYAVFTVEGGVLDQSIEYWGRQQLGAETIVEEYRFCNLPPDEAVELCMLVDKHMDVLNSLRAIEIDKPVYAGL